MRPVLAICIAVALSANLGSSAIGQGVTKPADSAGTTARSSGVSSGPFRNTEALESAWKSGVSTPDDVRRLVGAPTGSGSFVGIVDYRPYDIWFFDDIEILDAKGVSGATPPTIEATFRQQFLMVFFRDGRYQGHMWFSNDGAVTGWVR